MTDAAAAPPGLRRARALLRSGLRWGAGIVLAGAGLVLAVWLVLVQVVMPDVERFRPRIAAEASRLLGAAVEIGHVAAASRGWAPTFELRDVVVRDAAGRAALTLPRVLATVSPRSLIGFAPRLELLRIDGPTLEVRRDAGGRLTVAGLDLGGQQAGPSAVSADWFFTQFAILVRGGSIRWVDEQRAAPPLVLSDADIELRNGARTHELRIAATPPPAWGDRFTLDGRFTQPLFAHAGDWRRWSGSIAASLPRADVGELRRRVDLPFQLDSGAGSLRATIELRDGALRGAALDLTLRAVQLRLAADVAPLALAELAGHLDATRDAGGFTVSARQLGFVTADGARWPAGDLRLDWRQGAAGPPVGGEFSAERIDLAVVAQLAARMPLGAPLRRLLDEVAPQGEMTGLAASWRGALDAPTRYQVKAAVANLSLRAKPAAGAQVPGRPGVSKAQLTFSASEAGGEAQLGISDGQVELPGVWADPQLAVTSLAAQVSWTIGDRPAHAPQAARPLSVQVRASTLANADLQGDFKLAWSTGAGEATARGGRFPGRLDLSGRLTRGNAAAVARYLPLGLGEEARNYVKAAAFQGQIASASFRVRGDLWDFPFGSPGDPKDSEFHIAARLSDVECACVPPRAGASAGEWPTFTRVTGGLVFDRAAMEIQDAQAQVRGLTLSGVRARIPDLAVQPRLAIEGRVRGPLAEMLRYVADTPVAQWTGHALTAFTGSGAADLQLALAIPFLDAPSTTVKGSLTLDGNDLLLRSDLPPLTGVRTRIDFSERGWSVQGGRARLLGGESTIDGGSSADGNTRITARGEVSADGLRRAGGLGAVSGLAASLSGQTRYRAVVNLVRGQPEIALASDLVGVAVALPPPLRKNAETPLPLRVRSAIAPESLAAGQTLRDTLSVDLGTLAHAQYERELEGGSMRVVRGAIGVQQAVSLPARGVAARLHVDALNADEWQQAAARWPAPGTAAGAAPRPEVPGAGDYMPTTLALEAQELIAGPAHATKVVADAVRDAAGWRAEVAADTLALRGKPLGRLEMSVTRRAAAAPGDSPDPWRLTRLLIAAPEARLEGHGGWSAGAAAAGRSTLDFKLALDDSGAFLDRLGLPHAVKGGKGALSGQLSWPGPVWEPALATLGGQLKLELAAGQFLKAEPGAARLLGVLSLQSLPRRLTLDFRDLFDAGFAFDDVTGDVTIAQGVASTRNLRMRGAQAAVLMEGSADILRETQDLHVLVVPEINAGTASLAYAVINPALGLGTFLAQVFLRQPLTRAATREFQITGAWVDPKVEALNRPAAASAPGPEAGR